MYAYKIAYLHGHGRVSDSAIIMCVCVCVCSFNESAALGVW